MSFEHAVLTEVVQEARETHQAAENYFDKKFGKRFKALDKIATPDGSITDPFPNEEITAQFDVEPILRRRALPIDLSARSSAKDCGYPVTCGKRPARP